MGGMASVGQDGGAVFTAVLPGCLVQPEPLSLESGVPLESAVPQPRALS
jgi:hypothetical protein